MIKKLSSQIIKLVLILLTTLAFIALEGVEAEEHFYHWEPLPSQAQKDDAGRVSVMDAIFNDVTNSFHYQVTFVPVGGLLPDGFILVMNAGGPPPAHPGELAAFYFDASEHLADSSAPVKLTVYGYAAPASGPDWERSYKDGNGDVSGIQPPDRIKSSILDSSWVSELSVTNNIDGSRTFTMTVDVTDINSHSPLYPLSPEWVGVEFNNNGAGIWLEAGAKLETFYTDGYLTTSGCDDGDTEDPDCLNWVTLPGGGTTVYDMAGQCTELDQSGAKCGPPDCLGEFGGSASFDDQEVCCKEEEKDQCGRCFGDNTSCLGCEGVDISETQLTLDGASHDQSNLVQRIGKRIRKASRAKRDRKFARKIMAQAKDLATANWVLTYSIPSVFDQCTNSILCVQVDNTPTIENYRTNARTLRDLALKALKRYKKLTGKKGKRFKKLAESLLSEAEAVTEQVPLFQSSCF
ncbi:MAG: hypothetical protein D6719_10495 [Candidatus Dadabacteria bacterium]|nr:MAG: hypothetical protein D6719_10495 [Candidatus Dadabacteria bacterium]